MGSDAVDDNNMTLSRLQSAVRSFQSSGRPFQLIHQTAAAPRKCRTLIVLDSSFNPPTFAHMQMATSALHSIRAQQNTAASSKHGVAGDLRLLLLLAVKNADKAPTPATMEERLLMMKELTRDVQRAWRTLARQAHSEHALEDEETLPVDIGLTAHAYFHDKSAAIAASSEYDFPPNPTSEKQPPHAQHIFLAGYDTLIRIFNPQYYRDTPVSEVGPVQPAKTAMQTALDPFFARAQLRVTMRTDDDWGGREDQLGYLQRIMHGNELEKLGGRNDWARRVELVEGLSGNKDGVVVSSTLARDAAIAKDWSRLRELVPENVASLIELEAVKWSCS